MTTTNNNFEPAKAVAVAVLGFHSGATIAAVIGLLMEVPATIGLVNMDFWPQKRWYPLTASTPAAIATTGEARHP